MLVVMQVWLQTRYMLIIRVIDACHTVNCMEHQAKSRGRRL